MGSTTTKHRSERWASQADFSALLKRVEDIGPILEKNADENDGLGRLNDATCAALEPLRLSHVPVSEDLGGAQLSPSQALELIEAITYFSGSAGWVALVRVTSGTVAAGYLPESAIARLFRKGTINQFSGQGAPTGTLKKVSGGYLLNGRWSYASGIYHASFMHCAAFLEDGQGRPAKDEHGNVIALISHVPAQDFKFLGNWDVLGLKATGSIDIGAKDVFVPDDMVFTAGAEPQRLRELLSLGIVGVAAIGHSGWAMGAARRMLDEIATYARGKTGRANLLSESDKFWFDFGRAEGKWRAARAFFFDVLREIEASIDDGRNASTRQLSLIHLAKSEVHEAGMEACQFAYRAAGGASLRAGVMQRIYRDMMTAANHITINPNIVGMAGRELAGLWSDRVWRFYDLVEEAKDTKETK